MKTDFSVYASLLSATPADAENIAAWLADREAARDAMKMSVDMTVQNAEQLAAESGEYDEEIAVSQIRILSKRYTAEPDVIPCVAVVDKWDDDMWLIVPFSPYKTPATQGEMKTGLDAYGLHVLQAWNGRTVQDQILKKSYLFGTLPEEVRVDALSLFRHELGGVPLPENFTAERGSRIVEAADPRREYLDECIGRLTPLAEAVLKESEVGVGASGGGILQSNGEDAWISFDVDEYGIAAADACVGDVQDFQVEDFDGIVRFELARQDRCVYVRVYDGQGELSNVMDGVKIVGGHGNVVGTICDCGACMSWWNGFDGRLSLVTAEGDQLNLRKAEEP